MTSTSIAYYWQEYRHIEKKVLQASRIVDFCDSHLSVYSAEFAEILFLIGSLNESLISELYSTYRFPIVKKDDSKSPDFGCIVTGIKAFWRLRGKRIYINTAQFHFSDRVITPFADSCWYYKAYLAVKHERGTGGLKKATVGVVINALAAMFVLCVYAKNQEFPQGSLHIPLQFDLSLGSEIFRVGCYNTRHFPYSQGVEKNADFENSNSYVYVSVYKKNAYQALMKLYEDYIAEQPEKRSEELRSTIMRNLGERLRVAHLNNHEVAFNGDGNIHVPLYVHMEQF